MNKNFKAYLIDLEGDGNSSHRLKVMGFLAYIAMKERKSKSFIYKILFTVFFVILLEPAVY